MSETLNVRQMEILETLVATPSWYVQNGDPKGRTSNNECAVLEIIQEYFEGTGCVITRQLVDGGPRFNLIVEKGTGDFTIMMYGHADTVYPDKNWEHPLRLTSDGDSLHGLGAYDMKAGLMAMIDVMREIEVPKGIKLIAVFSPDEEENSRGALALRTWEGMARVDLAISPEIVTLQKRNERDDPKDVIAGRRGHIKTYGALQVPKAHGFDRNAPRASTEVRRLLDAMEDSFNNNSRNHKHFGQQGELFDIRELVVPASEGLSVTTQAGFKLGMLTLPDDSEDTGSKIRGCSEEDILNWQLHCLKKIEEERGWVDKKVRWTLDLNTALTSYQPYIVDVATPLAKQTLDSIDRVYGGHKLKGGASTSDGNILYPHLQQYEKKAPWFEVGPIGSGAHERTEQVSQRSIVLNIEWIHYLIKNQIPEFLASK